MSVRLTPKQAEAVGAIIASSEGAVSIIDDTEVVDGRSVVVEVNDKPVATVGGRGKVTQA